MLLALVFAGGSLFAQSGLGDASGAQQTYTVRGTVTNSVTHEPIARALVTIAGAVSSAQLTDSNGGYEFANVPAGRCVLQSRRPGYFALGLGRDVYRTVVVGPQIGNVMLTLEPAASITGQITLSTTDSPDNISVQLIRRMVQEGRARWQLFGSKRTNSEGIVRFGNLQGGEYRLATENSIDPEDAGKAVPMRWGFPAVWYPDAGSSVRLRPGQQIHAQLALTREPFYSVTIPVANDNLQAISSQVLDADGHIVESSATYDGRQHAFRMFLPNGNYTFTGLLYASMPGFGSVPITVRGSPITGQSLTVLPVQPIPVAVQKEFTAPEDGGAQIIAIEGGARMEISRDINLMLLSNTDNGMTGGNLRREPGSADNTAWMLENVMPGSYWVLSYANQGYVASITAGGTDLAREPLVVGPGGSSAPITVVLRNDTATLAVRLKNAAPGADDTSQPPSVLQATPDSPRAYVYMIPQFEMSSVLPEARPMEQTATFSNIPPGTYRVFALDRAFDLAYRDSAALEDYASTGQMVTLEPGGTASVDLDIISAQTGTP